MAGQEGLKKDLLRDAYKIMDTICQYRAKVGHYENKEEWETAQAIAYENIKQLFDSAWTWIYRYNSIKLKERDED